MPSINIDAIRADFPILARQVRSRPLVYFDNAATTHKPLAVIDAVSGFYHRTNANVHRGLHALSEEATAAYENARQSVQRFIGAASPEEVIFTRGCTEAINLVAHSFGRSLLRPGDQVLLTVMEHHSNIVPWQLACEQAGAAVRAAPMNDRGELLIDEFEKLLSERTRIVAMTHVSNALGTVNPVQALAAMARRVGAAVVVDGAQAMAHGPVNVTELGCDFYAFSGHKMLGPTGVGVLYGRRELLAAMPPWQGGGEMIRTVSFEKTTFKDPPARFEAGTPPIAGAIGLAAAIEYVQRIGFDAITAHERDLLAYATQRLADLPRVRLTGTAAHKAAVLAFVIDGVHPHDIATILDRHGVAIRAGHHCCQPLMRRLGVPATARASLALYNTREEVDVMIEALRKAIALLA